MEASSLADPTPETPEVTVVIPAYNAEATLAETLRSVLTQTFTDFEVLVMDDGSTDRTCDVALSLADSRVRLIQLPNGGVSRARNEAIAQAKGLYVAFLDADDLWLPPKLERQITLMRARSEVGLCVTRASRIDAASRSTGEMPILDHSDDYTEALLMHSSIVGGVSAAMMRSDIFPLVGGFEPGQRQAEDWDFWLRASLQTEIAVISEALVLQRVHDGNTSGNAAELERYTFPTLDRFFALPRAAPYGRMRRRVYARHWMICSGSYLHQGQLGNALRCLLRGVASHPSSVSKPLGLPLRWLRRCLSRPKGSS